MKKNKSIRSSLFISYSLIIIFVVSVFATFFFIWESNLIKKQALESINTFADSLKKALELEIKTMDTVSMNIVSSDLVQERFNNYEAHTGDNTIDQINARMLTDVMMSINGSTMLVRQINLYDFNGSVVGTGFDNLAHNADVYEKEWCSETLLNNGKKVLTSPFQDVDFSNNVTFLKGKYFIALCRLYINAYGLTQGIVEVRQFHDTVFSSFEDFEHKNPYKGRILVYNDAGKIIYPVEEKLDESYVNYKSYSQEMGNDIYSTVTDPVSEEKLMIVNKRSDFTGWTIAVIVSYNELLSPVFSLVKIIAFTTMSILFLALVFSFFAAKKYTRPISRLHSLINSNDFQNKSLELPDMELNSGLYELEDLNNAFRNMNEKIKKSVEDLLLSQHNELLSRMLALQSQMNPHLLYNLLATISAMADENMNEEISEMCCYISDLLRYISSDKLPLVTISTEIEYTKKYLACMKFRYSNELSYTIEINDELNGIRIPKMIIQPLVENALKYGTTKEPPWNIEIRGYMRDCFWLIDIMDNGKGFDEKILEEFNQKVIKIEQDGVFPNLELEGMGLLSIYIKLMLVYKDQKIFKITQNPEGGTIITIGGSICCDE